MILYAASPARRARQLLGDLLALAWVIGSLLTGRLVHDTVHALRGPADTLVGAGRGLADGLSSAGSRLQDLPLVGDELRGSLDRAAGTGTGLAQVGTELGTAVDRVAVLLGVLTALLGLLLVTLAWWRSRWRFAREATSAQRFVDAAQDLDLFALRALAHQPMRRLATVSDDPAGGWRRGDPVVMRQLALLELRDHGLRPPRESATS